MSDYDDEPVQEKIKTTRKKRELSEEQRKIMLANLEKGRKKRHENMRSKKPTQEKPQVKDDDDIPYDKTLSEPVKSTDNNNVIESVKEPEKPKKIKKKPRQIIYEKEESDTDNDEPVIVRRVKKQPQPQRNFSKPQYTEAPPPPRLMRSNQDIEELKKQQELKKKKQDYENYVRKTLNNFFV